MNENVMPAALFGFVYTKLAGRTVAECAECFGVTEDEIHDLARRWNASAGDEMRRFVRTRDGDRYYGVDPEEAALFEALEGSAA